MSSVELMCIFLVRMQWPTVSSMCFIGTLLMTPPSLTRAAHFQTFPVRYVWRIKGAVVLSTVPQVKSYRDPSNSL